MSMRYNILSVALKTRYICELCNHIHSKAWGWCQNCGAKNSLHEDVEDLNMPGGESETILGWQENSEFDRLVSGWEEFDTVCGGGIVVGSVILLGGEPGIGKSTLLAQLAGLLLDKVIYFSGEETLSQVSNRARRLQLQNFKILSTNSLESILLILKKEKPKLAIIDSIQSLRNQDGGGSTEQLRIFTMELVQCAKKINCALIIVGHVTKTGNLAGPKLLEHMVDVVLTFEGDQDIRALRSSKNRFGSTDEVGLFSMTESGLETIADPSAHLCHFRSQAMPGSVIFPSREGSRRSMLVEIQALVARSHLTTPRRSVVGWDYNRTAILLAILENHAKIPFFDKDVYLNVVGGIRIMDAATADLAVAIAVLSSVKSIPIPHNMAAFGEVTLSGDVRPAKQKQERLALCQKHGISNIICAEKVLQIDQLVKELEKDHRNKRN